MSDNSKIEWTDATWNPVTGCTRVSEGCRNCYIDRTPAFRIQGRKFVNGTTGVQLHPDRLDQPLRWKRQRRIFVNSLSDLFHEDVPDEFIAAVFGVMAACPSHTFQILTKRPERMRKWFGWVESKRGDLIVALVKQGGAWPKVDEYSAESVLCAYCAIDVLEPLSRIKWAPWPVPNVWLGVSIEDQATADERIPLLLHTPAAKRFISAEPLLGPVDLTMGLEPFHSHDPMLNRNQSPLDWVICGGESGPGARPCDLAWIRSVRDQCKAADVPVFIKQLGSAPMILEEDWRARKCAWMLRARHRDRVPADYVPLKTEDRKGGDWSEWPADLRVREFPNV